MERSDPSASQHADLAARSRPRRLWWFHGRRAHLAHELPGMTDIRARYVPLREIRVECNQPRLVGIDVHNLPEDVAVWKEEVRVIAGLGFDTAGEDHDLA